MKSAVYIVIIGLLISIQPVAGQPPKAVLKADDLEKFIMVFPDYVNWLENQELLGDTSLTPTPAMEFKKYHEFSQKELKRVAWDLDDLFVKSRCILDCYYYITLINFSNDPIPENSNSKQSSGEMTELGQMLESVPKKSDEQVLVEDVMGLLKYNPEDLKKVQSYFTALNVMMQQIEQSNFLAQQTSKSLQGSPRPSKNATWLR